MRRRVVLPLLLSPLVLPSPFLAFTLIIRRVTGTVAAAIVTVVGRCAAVAISSTTYTVSVTTHQSEQQNEMRFRHGVAPSL
jgi:hypothetical protein